MATTITSIVGEDQPDAVIATTITSFAISSMLTGICFYLMGKFRLGYLIGFIPRHILIGCIGGVGWFLVATGFEVSARLEEFSYDLDTGRRLIQSDTLPLWLIPLALAIILFGLQKKISSKYFLPIYILCVPVVFYFFVFSIDSLDPENLRQAGWIFEAPEAGQPWWYFWTLYSELSYHSSKGVCYLLIPLEFDLVRWDAILETVGAMFALTFFSVLRMSRRDSFFTLCSLSREIETSHSSSFWELSRSFFYSCYSRDMLQTPQNFYLKKKLLTHVAVDVPINLPSLAQISGEDNLDLDRELKLHGYSNFLSGIAGSIQNYLVFANTLFFMRSGGDSRLAGFMLAALTFGVLMIGPVIIGYIPVMVVGTLIFVLGFELLLDALITPRRKLKLLEYLTASYYIISSYRHDRD